MSTMKGVVLEIGWWFARNSFYVAYSLLSTSPFPVFDNAVQYWPVGPLRAKGCGNQLRQIGRRPHLARHWTVLLHADRWDAHEHNRHAIDTWLFILCLWSTGSAVLFFIGLWEDEARCWWKQCYVGTLWMLCWWDPFEWGYRASHVRRHAVVREGLQYPLYSFGIPWSLLQCIYMAHPKKSKCGLCA